MRSQTGQRGSGTDDGFTLVELIMAIAIIGVITVPLGNVVIGFLRNTDTTTGRLIESHDAQIASAYWARDVAAIGRRLPASPFTLSQSVETDVAPGSGLFPCGEPGTPNAIVRFASDEVVSADESKAITVAYVVEPVPDQPSELHRLRCVDSTTPASDTILAHNLDLDPSTPPTLVCTTPADCTAAPTVPETLTLTLTLRDPKNSDRPYVVRLTGQRRQS